MLSPMFSSDDLPDIEDKEKCRACDGVGSRTFPAEQIAGEIIDERTVECRMCKGTGVRILSFEEEDQHDPDQAE
jgi:hypothetical protein